MEIDPTNKILVLAGDGVYHSWNIDPAYYDGNGYAPKLAGSSSGSQNCVTNEKPTLSYDSNSGKMICWVGGTTVYVLDASTDTWTSQAGTGDTPPTPDSNGIYGRWRYAPVDNVFVMANQTSQDVYVYRYATNNPRVTDFDVEASTTDMRIAVNTFDTADATHYLINDSNTPTCSTPTAGDSDWSTTKPTSYDISGGFDGGAGDLYVCAWAKDGSDNISSQNADTISVNLQNTVGAITVGPYRTYTTLGVALAAATHGDRIEVDATTYTDDQVDIELDNLTIVGWSGNPRVTGTIGDDLMLAHFYYDSCVSGDPTGAIEFSNNAACDEDTENVCENLTLEYIEISNVDGCTASNIGAFYLTGSSARDVTMRYVYIHDNEVNGIRSSGTSNNDIVIEYSRIESSGPYTGTHNIYIGEVDTLTFRYNYSANVKVGWGGHLLKSRARTNYIEYNRFTNENENSSYELQIAEGGTAYVIGNLFYQPDQAENNTIVMFGDEDQIAPMELYFINNTVVDEEPGTVNALNVHSSTTVFELVNNIFVGVDNLYTGKTPTTESNNLDASSDPGFVDMAGYDYDLLVTATTVIDQGTGPGSANGYSLTPTYEYVHTADAEERLPAGNIDIGAYEYGAPTVSSATIGSDGQTVDVEMSEVVTAPGYDNGDFILNCAATGNGISLNNISIDGTTLTLTAAVEVFAGDPCTIDYNGTTGEIIDADTNDLEACEDCATVTNDSGHVAATISSGSGESGGSRE
jgi:hypothetical protein